MPKLEIDTTFSIPEKILNWIENANDEDLFRINIKLLSKELEYDFYDLLTFFIKAVNEGLFTLSWEYHCPHCNAVPGFTHNFSNLKSEDFCQMCNVSFRNTLDSNIEVTFTINPAVYRLPDEISQKYMNVMMSAAKTKTYIIPDEFLSGLEIMNNHLFYEYFGDQVLSVEESLQIQRITILFTDIKGSTSLYHKYGDVKSYNVVRDHFKILFDKVINNHGTIVKTIGDSIMASFIKPFDAIKAALEAQKEFIKSSFGDIGKLDIKMGIHSGGVIVVNLNDRIDYFGNTVNVASRIESLSEGGAIWFSKEIYSDPQAIKYLKKHKNEFESKVYRKKAKMKGLEEYHELYNINLYENIRRSKLT